MSDDLGRVTYQVEGPLARITLSRPGKRNAMTQRMFRELAEAVDKAAADGEVRVLVIEGEGGHFCAGDDLGELSGMETHEVRPFLAGVQRTFRRMEELAFPVLAAVEGYALGGGLELALACDLILASETARLGLPETNLGIIPGLGGCVRLPRRVGLGKAKELVYSGRLVKAPEALEMGLVDRVFPPGRMAEEVSAYAAMLAEKSPLSLSLAKAVLSRGLDASLEAGLVMEREAFAVCFAHPDAKEGIGAFLEKRKPVFGGGS